MEDQGLAEFKFFSVMTKVRKVLSFQVPLNFTINC